MNRKYLIVLVAVISFIIGIEQVNALEPSCGDQSGSKWLLKDVRIDDRSLATTTTDTQKIQCCSIGTVVQTYVCDIYEVNPDSKEETPTATPTPAPIQKGQKVGTNCGVISDIVPYIKELYGFLKIALPIALIIFGAMDFTTPILSNDKEALTKATVKFTKRCIVVIAVFFVPTILKYILNAYSDATGKDASLCGLLNIWLQSWR